jgi:hypothetical protein
MTTIPHVDKGKVLITAAQLLTTTREVRSLFKTATIGHWANPPVPRQRREAPVRGMRSRLDDL